MHRIDSLRGIHAGQVSKLEQQTHPYCAAVLDYPGFYAP